MSREPGWGWGTWGTAAALAVAVAAFCVVAGAIALTRYWRFEIADSAEHAWFYQRVWQAAFLDRPARTLFSTEHGDGLLAGRHFEPGLALLVPAVRAFPSAATLLVVQALAVGLAAVPAYRIGRRLTGDTAAAALLAASFLLLPGTWHVSTHYFRAFTLALPLLLGAWAAAVERRGLATLALALLAASFREELVWVLLAGIPLAVGRDPGGGWRWRSALALAAVAGGWWLMLHGLRGDVSDFVATGDVVARARDTLRETLTAAKDAEAPGAWILPWFRRELGPGLLLAPAAPLAALPVVANWLGFHTSAGMAGPFTYHLLVPALATVPLVQAAAVGRIARGIGALAGRWGWRPDRARGVTSRLLAGALAVGAAHGLWGAAPDPGAHGLDLLRRREAPAFQQPDTPWAVIRNVPAGAPVMCSHIYAPVLASRPVVYMIEEWTRPELRRLLPWLAPWAVVPSSYEDVLGLLEAAGFRERGRSGGAVLLHRRAHSPLDGQDPLVPL
ncbi:DUF2079 domain-containing protein [Myxococcota bacterium]|nr:DUF2079 domain-containing protein [Myxococcota bacterium]